VTATFGTGRSTSKAGDICARSGYEVEGVANPRRKQVSKVLSALSTVPISPVSAKGERRADKPRRPSRCSRRPSSLTSS
jgi:hypothetical protein